jgi:4-hydroxybenzoate polyprenyltransferase
MEHEKRPEVTNSGACPLVVDADGALVKTNLLHENAMQFLARKPFAAWRLPLWIARGGDRLVRELDTTGPCDLANTPLRGETLDRIRGAQEHGTAVYLVSACGQNVVDRLANSIGGIAGVFVEAPGATGMDRAERLNAVLGSGAYDYIGNRPADFAVWPSARRVMAVSSSPAFSREVNRNFPNAEIIAEPRQRPATYFWAMRPHQWAKNLLVFLSLAAGHHFAVRTTVDTFIAFVCFCLAASSAYLLNDMLDIPSDRAHPRKRTRAFAAGDLPISHGLALSISLMLAALSASLMLPARFTLILMVYVALTIGYSVLLKRKLLVDVIALGGLYTIRVLGGIAAVGSAYSYWLLMFCLFFFLGLATVKRCSELVSNAAAGASAPSGRGYRYGDLTVLFPLAAAACYGSVLVVALYLASPEVIVLYRHPLRLWLLCPLLLYWVSRVLVLASRNELHHDPVTFALTDRISWRAGAVALGIVLVAI